MSPLRRQPLTIEHALLGFMRQQPMYGYEIHQRLSELGGVGRVWQLKQSRLYSLLTKLEKGGLIEAVLEPQPPRPPRKVLHLTPKGEAAFATWVRTPVGQGHKLRLDFMTKLYFAQKEGVGVVGTLISGQRHACRQWLEEEQRLAEQVGDAEPYEWLLHQFRIGQIEAMLAWLDQCEQQLLNPVAE